MKPARQAPGPRLGVLLQLLRTAETLWNASRVFFDRWDLGPSQFNVLKLLRDAPGGLTQVALSRQLLMHRSNVTGLIDRMERRGLVRRRDVPRDRRAYRVVLTAAGARLVREILPHYYQVAELVCAGLPGDRARQLEGELRAVCERARSLAAAPDPAS